MMKRGGGVDGSSGAKKSIYMTQGAVVTGGGSGGGAGGGAGGVQRTSRKLKNISAY